MEEREKEAHPILTTVTTTQLEDTQQARNKIIYAERTLGDVQNTAVMTEVKPVNFFSMIIFLHFFYNF